MNIRRSLVSLGVAGVLALSASAVMAQYPGGAATMGYPGGGSAGGSAGYPGGGYPGGGGAAGSSQTVTTTTTDTGATAPTTLAKGGGDPLSLTAAGSLLLSAGYAVRRRLRRA